MSGHTSCVRLRPEHLLAQAAWHKNHLDWAHPRLLPIRPVWQACERSWRLSRCTAWTNISFPTSDGRQLRPVLPDRRGEPVLESKSLAPVSSGQTILGDLEEPEVYPSHEEAELDENVWRRTKKNHQDVGHQKIQSRKGLGLSGDCQQAVNSEES
jgi:hypothetical protein